MNANLNIFYVLIAVVLLGMSYFVRPGVKGSPFYLVIVAGFIIGGIIFHAYILALSALLAVAVRIFKLHQFNEKNRTIKVILIPDRDDPYLNYFLNFYQKDIEKYFPHFDFRIEDEFLVALLFSNMETIGLIVAEIMDDETLKICIDYMVPKHRNSQLAKTFYQCELRCIDFLGYRQIFIEPQSKEHNKYLERIGFKFIDGKYFSPSVEG